MQLTVIFSMIFAILIAIFAGLNSLPVPVNLLFLKVEMSLAIVILMSTVVGAALMYFINMFKAFKNRKKIKSLERENKKLLAQRDEYKNQLENSEASILEVKKAEESDEIKE